MACFIWCEEHLKAQAEGRRFSAHSSSINLTFQIALLLGGYSRSVSYDGLFLYVVSTYWKPASTVPPLDLSLVSIGTFHDVTTIFPNSGQVGGSSKRQRLVFTSNSWICIPGA
jgi:hypothetical protein